MRKKTLIFIPGLGYSNDIWENVTKSIPIGKYNIFLMPIHPYGTTYKGKILNFDSYGYFLSDKLREFNLKPPYILVGHSLGGYIALIYASLFSKLVEKVVAVSVPLRRPESRFPLSWKLIIYLATKSKTLGNGIKNISLTQNKFFKRVIENYFKGGAGFLRRCEPSSVAACMNDLGKYDWPTVVKRVVVPVLLVYGKEDKAVTMIQGTELYSEFKYKEIISLPCGHNVPIWHPARLAKEIVDFAGESTAK